MIFDDKIRHNRIFQGVVQKVGESEIKYIKIFQISKALKFSVGNSYTGYQLIHTLLKNSGKLEITLLR